MDSPVIPIAIVGGGPVGLSASILLSLRGIPHVLFERYPGTSIHPKAVGINQRTMEVFRVLGIEQDVYDVSAPPDRSLRTAWYTSLGPNGTEIFSRDAWGGGEFADEYERASPSHFCMLPQIRLEPVLARRALALNPECIRRQTEVTSLDETGDGSVIVKFRSTKNDDEQGQVRARFVICADGGRTFTRTLGVDWTGQKDIFKMVTAHFEAPLRDRHPDPTNFLTWFSNPRNEGSVKSGAIYQIGPWPTPEDGTEEWVFIANFLATDPTSFTAESMTARIKDALEIEDMPIDILSISHWNVNAISAARYRVGRVFLVGDAAHQVPPWGALGMNTGVQDVQNLVWKLEMALKDEKKHDALLDSYDTERRPIGQQAGITSLNNILMHRGVVDAAVGISDEKSLQENQMAIAILRDETHPENRAKREAIKKASNTLDLEFKAPGNEVGWFYPSADINGEGDIDHAGQISADGTFDQTTYHPSTIPGHNLPHSWVQRDGERVAVRDLVPLNKMLLLARSEAWKPLESDLVHVEVVGPGGWDDVSGDWEKQCGVCSQGAVLVRPDGVVGWRGEFNHGLLQAWPAVLEKVLYLPSSLT